MGANNEQRPKIVVLNAALIALTLVATGSRVWRRVFIMRNFELSDGLIVVAAVAAISFSMCQIIATHYGMGGHMVDMNMGQWPTLMKILLTSNVFYFFCNWAVKHALLFFYTSLTTTIKQLRLIYFMHFVAFCFGLSSVLVVLLQCRPMRKNWDRGVPGSCINRRAFYYANVGIMLATDIVLYGMPLVFTRGLKLTRSQKWGVRGLFGLGGLILAASAARVVSTYHFATQPDFPYRFANIMIWAVIENHLAVVVACAPSIKAAIILIFPRMASFIPKIIPRLRRSRYSNTSDMENADTLCDKDGESRSKSANETLEVTTTESDDFYVSRETGEEGQLSVHGAWRQ